MDNLEKTRRNFLIASTAICLVHLGKVDFYTTARSLPFIINFKNPSVIIYMLWVLWGFFLWRFWQMTKNNWGELSKRVLTHLSNDEFFIALLLERAKRNQPEYPISNGKNIHSTMKVYRCFFVRVCSRKTTGDGLIKPLSFVIHPFQLSWYRVIYKEHMFFIREFIKDEYIKDEYIASLYMPCLIAIITLVTTALMSSGIL